MNLAPILAARLEVAFRNLEHHSGLRRLEPSPSTAFAFGTGEHAQRIAEAEAKRIAELAALLVPDKRERSAVLARASLANTWPIRFEVPEFDSAANIQDRMQRLRATPIGSQGSGLFGHLPPQPFRPRAVRYGVTWRGPAEGCEIIVRTERGRRSIIVAVLPPIPDVALRRPPGTAEEVAAAQSKWVAAMTLLSREGPPPDAEQAMAALDEAPGVTLFFGRWPGNVTAEQVAAALDKAPRTHEDKALATTIAGALRADFLTAAREYDASPLPPLFCAMVLSVLGEVRADAGRRMIAIDAGKPHHAMLAGMSLAAGAETLDIEPAAKGTWKLFFPEPADAEEPKLQLTLLDVDAGESPNETLLAGIKQWRSAFGLRNWIALQKLLSDAGRSGKVFWRVEDHLDALGLSSSWRSRPENRNRVIDEVRALMSIVLVYQHENEEQRIRARILSPGAEFDVRQGAAWELDGIELTIHPSLYSGVRRQNGAIGRNFWPLPPELATVDHDDFGPALAMGPILAIRFRLAAQTSEVPELRIGAAKLLKMAGLDAADKGRGHARRVLDQLAANLDELVRIGVLASATWEKPGDLRSIVVLRPAAASVDRAVRGLQPTADVHPALVAALPATGAELAAWRKERKLTQGALALALGCSERTIRSAEGAEGERLNRKLAGALRDRFGTGKNPAHGSAKPAKTPHTDPQNRQKPRTRIRNRSSKRT